MLKLNQYEIRVLGCLIEKSITTPEQYPLSLNTLQAACNQKTNRDPVLAIDQNQVQQTLGELCEKKLVTEVNLVNRVPKYKQRFCNTEFSEFHLTTKELGILCVLFLRSSQTPGEIRTNSRRLCEFTDLNEVMQTLEEMSSREDIALVTKLSADPGKREAKYCHLFADEPAEEPADSNAEKHSDLEERFAALQEEVTILRNELNSIKQELDL